MIVSFKNDLSHLTTIQMYRKYILNTHAEKISDDMQLSLKEKIADKFSVEYHDIIIVGSCKLGFSIKPSRRYQAFNDDSDIDVAIISKILFEKVWNELYSFKNSKAFWPKANTFFEYLSYGWIRPDCFPQSQFFKFTQEWWDFFNYLTKLKTGGPYKIRAGIYYSHFFLEEYQQICINQCKEEII